MSRGSRPVYLNLLKIRLPIPGVVSFAHRVSGVLLFIAIPFSIYLLEHSLADPASYQAVRALLWHPLVVPFTVVLAWSLLHHLLAGIRFLLIDLDIGIEKFTARKTAWAVLFGALALSALLLVRWWT